MWLIINALTLEEGENEEEEETIEATILNIRLQHPHLRQSLPLPLSVWSPVSSQKREVSLSHTSPTAFCDIQQGYDDYREHLIQHALS